MRSRTRRVSRLAFEMARRLSSADGLSAVVVIRGSAPGRVLHASAYYAKGVALLVWDLGLSVWDVWSWRVFLGMDEIDRSVYFGIGEGTRS